MTVKHTEAETDGGLDWTYDDEDAIQMTFQDRLREFYHNHVYEPGLVVMDDWRFKVGGLLILMYFIIGTVGVILVPPPELTSGGASNFQQAFDWHAIAQIGGLTLAYPTFQDLAYPLGTDHVGRSIFSLLVHATPRMLVMLFSGGVFATAVATILGTVSGYKGGTVDNLITTFNDIAMTIPGLPLVMILGLALNGLGVFPYLRGLPEPANLLLPALVGVIVMINYWGGLSRAIRSQVLTLREANYVEASRTMGIGTPTIIYKDVLPNLMPYILINFVNASRFVVFSAVGLYYLGVLPQVPANWGVMLNRGYRQGGLIMGLEGWNQIFPVVFMILGIALGTMLMSQGMDRLFNPRVRTKLAEFDGDDDEDTMDEVMNE